MQERPPQPGDPMHGPPPRSADELRALNAMMATRIRQSPPQPYREGSVVLRVAEIRGRRSGRVIPVPIGVYRLNGKNYLTSPNRQRAWVHNLLASGECTLVAGDERERYHAVLVNADEATPVLRDYTAYLGARAGTDFPFPPGAPDSVIHANADKTAVFRLDPRG